MTPPDDVRRRLPPAWLVALLAIEAYWLALGRRHLGHIPESPTEALPLVLAGLGVVAALGLYAGGTIGRAIAGLIAAGGAIYALAVVGSILVMILTAGDGVGNVANAWGFLAIFVGIAAGYVLILRRAVRGRVT